MNKLSVFCGLFILLLVSCTNKNDTLPGAATQALDSVIKEAAGEDFTYEIVNASKANKPEETPGLLPGSGLTVWCVEINQEVEVVLAAMMRSLAGTESAKEATTRFFLRKPNDDRQWSVEGVNPDTDAWNRADCSWWKDLPLEQYWEMITSSVA